MNNRIVMANGGKVILIPTSGNATEVSDADAPTTVTHVAFLDRYIITNKTNTTEMWWCDVNDETAWTATSFAQAEANADYIKSLMTEWNEILALGTKTTEVWFNDGTTPFVAYKAGYSPNGVGAEYSAKFFGNTWYYLDQQFRFTKIEQRTPTYVGTPIEKTIQGYTTKTDALGDLLEVDGRPFYLLTFPTENVTWVYDYELGHWYQWGEWNAGNSNFDRMRWNCTCWSNTRGLWLAGGRNDATIYQVGSGIYKDVSAAIRLRVRGPYINHGTGRRKRCRELLFVMRRGVEGDSNTINNLSIRWRSTRKTWSSSYNIPLYDGTDYQYHGRLKKLGMYRFRQLEVTDTDDTSPMSIASVEEDFEVMGR
jgi:hypothetical protein